MVDVEKEIEKIIDLIKEERVFLHDISNYVVVLQGITNYLENLDISDPGTIDSEKFTKRTEGLSKTVNKLVNDVKVRQTKLKKISFD
tara:strand:+ start:266819 stop:267079 length:261 start_codon:yes stop_codon:yes gene_type:complete